MILFSPELVGYDPTIAEVFPIHDMIGVLRRHGAFFQSLSEPYYLETGEGRLYEHQFQNTTLSSINEDSITLVDRFGRESILEAHKGGWKHIKFSTNLRNMYLTRINTEEKLDAFIQNISYLRPRKEKELSSNIVYAYQSGNEVFNNTWWNQEYWEIASQKPLAHTLRWKLINGDTSWRTAQDEKGEEIEVSTDYLFGSYSDMNIARSVIVQQGEMPGYQDGVFTYNPNMRFSRLRLELDFGRNGRLQIFNLQIA